MITTPPLDMDLSTVKTDFPLLADGYYEVSIKKAEVVTSKKGGEMVKIELQTIGPSLSRTGEQLAPGSVLFDQMMLAPSGKGTWEMVMRNVGALVQSLGLTGVNMGNIKTQIPTLQGRTLRIQVGYEPAKDGYREKNVVAKYVKQGATA